MTTNPSAEFLATLVCPVCRTPLEEVGETLHCGPCRHPFPIVLGIPDLRVHDDPLIPRADDYRKGERLLAEAEHRSFAELVEFYWTLPTDPPTPPPLARRFVHHVLTDGERIRAYEHRLGQGQALLDVGCGAGMLVQAAYRGYATVVGCDVGFRWLVVARHGLLEAGRPATLVCACADHLPFAQETFDTVSSVALLEHLPSPGSALREFRRVLRPGGRVFTWTTNRFSLAPEPHVGLLGVGFLPRSWQPRYVRWRRNLAYRHTRLLGRGELSNALRGAGFHRLRYRVPEITPPDLVHRSGLERLAARSARVLSAIPGLSALLSWLAPALQVVAQASPGRGRDELR